MQKIKNRDTFEVKMSRTKVDFFSIADPTGGWENHSYLRDFIPIRPSPKLIENAELARKYLKSTLSAQQLADEYGVSK